MKMHATQTHGGWARQAKRRNEQFVGCNTCGGKRHVRQSFQVEPIIGGWQEVREIVGGLVVLGMFGVGFWLWLSIVTVIV